LKILANLENFAQFSKFCPIFKILPNFQNFAQFSKFWPIFKILANFDSFGQFFLHNLDKSIFPPVAP